MELPQTCEMDVQTLLACVSRLTRSAFLCRGVVTTVKIIIMISDRRKDSINVLKNIFFFLEPDCIAGSFPLSFSIIMANSVIPRFVRFYRFFEASINVCNRCLMNSLNSCLRSGFGFYICTFQFCIVSHKLFERFDIRFLRRHHSVNPKKYLDLFSLYGFI